MEEQRYDWEKIKSMKPYLRWLPGIGWEASVGTGFETVWWPSGIGATKEEAIEDLNKTLATI